MQRAQELESQQNLPAAIEALRTAVERRPDNAQAHLQLGFLQAKIGDPIASETELRRALELGAPAARVLPPLGAALLEMHQYRKLLKDISLPSDMLPEDLALLVVQRGRAHLALGDTADARTQFLTAAQYRPVEARLGLALVAAVEGDYAGADRLVDQVIAESPQSSAAWSVRGDLRQLRGEDREAAEAYRRAVSLDAGNVQAAASEAVLLVRAGDYAGARELIERAHGVRPGDVVVNFARAVLALHAVDIAAGRESIDRVRRTVPDHPLTTVLDAALLAAAGQLEQSEEVLSAYVRRDASDPYARKLLAGALLTKQLPDQALTVLQPLLTGEQRDPDVLALAGRSELQSGALRTGLDRLKLAVALTPGDARLRAHLGLAQLAMGDAAAAMEEFRASAHADSGGFNADLLLIAVLLGKPDVPAAVEAADALQKKLPNAAQAYLAKGAVRVALADPKGARAEFERAAKLDPEFFPAIAALARLDERDGAAHSALARVNAFLSNHGNHLEANVMMAEREAAAGNIIGAGARLLALTQNHPSNDRVSVMLAQLQLRSGETRQAISSAQRALSSNPRNAAALETLARAQRSLGDSAGAAATLSQLSALYPDWVYPLLLLADAQLAGRQRQQAETTVVKAVRLEPDNLDALVAMGVVYLDAQKWDKAQEVAGMLQRRDPRGVLGQALEGDILMGQREYARAAKAFERAIGIADSGELRVKRHQALSAAAGALAPDAELLEWLRGHPSDSRTRRYLAAANLDAGHIREAAEQYRVLVEADPRDAQALNNLAWTLHQLADPAALDLAQRARLLAPESAAIADTLGWLLLQSGRDDEALPLLTTAVSLDSTTPAIRYHRAEALQRVGDLGAARKELKQIVDTDARSEYATKALDLLRRMGS